MVPHIGGKWSKALPGPIGRCNSTAYPTIAGCNPPAVSTHLRGFLRFLRSTRPTRWYRHPSRSARSPLSTVISLCRIGRSTAWRLPRMCQSSVNRPTNRALIRALLAARARLVVVAGVRGVDVAVVLRAAAAVLASVSLNRTAVCRVPSRPTGVPCLLRPFRRREEFRPSPIVGPTVSASILARDLMIARGPSGVPARPLLRAHLLGALPNARGHAARDASRVHPGSERSRSIRTELLSLSVSLTRTRLHSFALGVSTPFELLLRTILDWPSMAQGTGDLPLSVNVLLCPSAPSRGHWGTDQAVLAHDLPAGRLTRRQSSGCCTPRTGERCCRLCPRRFSGPPRTARAPMLRTDPPFLVPTSVEVYSSLASLVAQPLLLLPSATGCRVDPWGPRVPFRAGCRNHFCTGPGSVWAPLV